MSDPIEFTPKEKLVISVYKEPVGLFKRTLVRRLTYIFPSVGLIAYSGFTGDMGYGLLGYLLLLFQAIHSLLMVKRGALTIASIIRKYEARLEMKSEN